MTLFSLKYVRSLPEVAINRGRGKALGDSRLRLSTSISRQSEAMLNMVTIINVARLAGAALPYWPPCIKGHVVRWLEPCVQGFNQENADTALQEKDIKALEPSFNRLKNRNNLRTTGFNLFGGKRSVRNTPSIREEWTQANIPNVYYRRLFSTTILFDNLEERVLVAELRQKVKECRNKDRRYGNLIQVICSLPTLKLAYLMVKNNFEISAKSIDELTLDAINLKTLQKMLVEVLDGRSEIRSARRVVVPKTGKYGLGFLGICSLRDEIINKSIEIVLIVVFEDVFMDCSHGFRPGRSCRTALKQLQLKIGNVSNSSWVIGGDVGGCFDNTSHKMLLKGLNKRVDCPSTLGLIKKTLKVGRVLDDDLKKQKVNAKVSNPDAVTPPGIALSQLFCNIVLHELDEFIELELNRNFTENKKRKSNIEYRKLRYRIQCEIDLKHRRKFINECFKVPLKDFYDKNFKRLFYVRYAGDWVILLGGSYTDAKTVRSLVYKKLQTLGLTLCLKKIHITSLIKYSCQFLGVGFFIRKNIDYYFKLIRLVKNEKITVRQRFAPRVVLHALLLNLLMKLLHKGFVKRNSKGAFFPIGKNNCILFTHSQILNYYNSKIRRILNYYSCADNRNELSSIIRFLRYSCALTLARKFKLKTLAKTFKKFGRDLTFVNDKGKKYKIFCPNKFLMLPIHKKFSADAAFDKDKLLNRT